ncbi:hypothetical protein OS493_037886, partial [Desmophyllum pertusum]
MKRLKPVSFKATFVDRRGSRRQDISLSLDRRTNVGATPDTNTNNSAELPVSSLHDYHLADLSETGDFQHSVSAHENRRIQEQIKWNEFRDRIVDVAIEDSYLPNCSCVWWPQNDSRGKMQLLWAESFSVLGVCKKPPLHYQQLPCSGVVEGNHHSKSISFCQCEHPIVTLVRLHLWPGSPDRPTTAFHFRLMDMATDMFIHCKVSLREFADVLEEKRPPLQPKL